MRIKEGKKEGRKDEEEGEEGRRKRRGRRERSDSGGEEAMNSQDCVGGRYFVIVISEKS